MDLKDFVAQTLVQIVEGVVAASTRVAELGGAVSPSYNANPTNAIGRSRDGQSLPVHAVEFDVAVIAGNESSLEAGGGLKIAVFSASAKGSEKEREQTTSRIQFVVPLQLPVDPKSVEAKQEHDAVMKQRQQEATQRMRGTQRRESW